MTLRSKTALLLLVLPLAACGEDQNPPRQSHYDAIIRTAVGVDGKGSDIDAFWRSEFSNVSDRRYESPKRFHPYRVSNPPEIACDIKNWSNNAFYCYRDSSISWDAEWLQRGLGEFNRFHDMAPLAIIGHEWGHHIQNLAGGPQYDLQRELQADCYSGLYIAYAEGSSNAIRLELGDVREAMLTFFRIGDRVFDNSRWFDAGVHGPPRSRALAFSAAYITENAAFCGAYADYQPSDGIQFGDTYWLTLLPASRPVELGSGIWRVRSSPRLGELTLDLQPRVDVTARPAIIQLNRVAERWFSPSRVSWVGQAEAFDATPIGSSAVRRYERTVTDTGGATQQIHGAVLLHIAGSGRGLLLDAHSPGLASEADWERLGDYLFGSLFGLQVNNGGP